MARWSDLFSGEETANASVLDMAKIQMFFFTLVIVVAYCSALGSMFLDSLGANGSPISTFPSIHPSMVILLGISHTGYLTNKAVPHSKQKTGE
jgi:hypothetical protein